MADVAFSFRRRSTSVRTSRATLAFAAAVGVMAATSSIPSTAAPAAVRIEAILVVAGANDAIVTLHAEGSVTRRIEAPDPGERREHLKVQPGRRLLAYTTFRGIEGAVQVIDPFNQDRSVQLGVGTDPAWNPAGTHVAYGHATGPLTIHDLSNATEKRYGPASTGAGRSHRCPEWSPDGTHIAAYYNSFEDAGGQGFHGELNEIRVYSAGDGGIIASRNIGASASCPTWSPDGTRVAFEEAGRITTMDVDTGRTQTATRGAQCFRDTDPAWGEHGILFSRVLEGSTGVTGDVVPSGCAPTSNRGLWITDTDVTEQVVSSQEDLYDPVWAPGTDTFAFMSVANPETDAQLRTWLSSLEANAPKELLPGNDGDVASPTFVTATAGTNPAGAPPTSALAPTREAAPNTDQTTVNSTVTTAGAQPNAPEPDSDEHASTSTTTFSPLDEPATAMRDTAESEHGGSQESLAAGLAAGAIAVVGASAFAVRRRRARLSDHH